MPLSSRSSPCQILRVKLFSTLRLFEHLPYLRIYFEYLNLSTSFSKWSLSPYFELQSEFVFYGNNVIPSYYAGTVPRKPFTDSFHTPQIELKRTPHPALRRGIPCT